MTEAPEPRTEPTAAAAEPRTVLGPPENRYDRPSRLNQVAAWVGIVAGVVFIVAVIFGTGFMVGKHSGYRGFDRDRETVMFHHRPPMFPMGPKGEFERPGPGPGFVFPGGPGFQPQPPQPPTAPATPTPSRN